MNTIHTFKAEGIEGEEIDFAAFADKKIIVVNAASRRIPIATGTAVAGVI